VTDAIELAAAHGVGLVCKVCKEQYGQWQERLAARPLVTARPGGSGDQVTALCSRCTPRVVRLVSNEVCKF
jgi:hypothetical protein